MASWVAESSNPFGRQGYVLKTDSLTIMLWWRVDDDFYDGPQGWNAVCRGSETSVIGIEASFPGYSLNEVVPVQRHALLYYMNVLDDRRRQLKDALETMNGMPPASSSNE